MKNGHSEEQTSAGLALAGGDRHRAVADICREHRSRESDVRHLEQKYSELGLSELRELRATARGEREA